MKPSDDNSTAMLFTTVMLVAFIVMIGFLVASFFAIPITANYAECGSIFPCHHN